MIWYDMSGQIRSIWTNHFWFLESLQQLIVWIGFRHQELNSPLSYKHRNKKNTPKSIRIWPNVDQISLLLKKHELNQKIKIVQRTWSYPIGECSSVS